MFLPSLLFVFLVLKRGHQVSFPPFVWEKISDDAKDFIKVRGVLLGRLGLGSVLGCARGGQGAEVYYGWSGFSHCVGQTEGDLCLPRFFVLFILLFVSCFPTGVLATAVWI